MDIHHKNLINDYINKAVKQTINKVVDAKVSYVVIGYNKGFKQNGIKSKKTKSEKQK